MVPVTNMSKTDSERELLQAVVASQDQDAVQLDPSLAKKLAELEGSSSAAEKRIVQVVPQLLSIGKTRITYVDWIPSASATARRPPSA